MNSEIAELRDAMRAMQDRISLLTNNPQPAQQPSTPISHATDPMNNVASYQNRALGITNVQQAHLSQVLANDTVSNIYHTPPIRPIMSSSNHSRPTESSAGQPRSDPFAYYSTTEAALDRLRRECEAKVKKTQFASIPLLRQAVNQIQDKYQLGEALIVANGVPRQASAEDIMALRRLATEINNAIDEEGLTFASEYFHAVAASITNGAFPVRGLPDLWYRRDEFAPSRLLDEWHVAQKKLEGSTSSRSKAAPYGAQPGRRKIRGITNSCPKHPLGRHSWTDCKKNPANGEPTIKTSSSHDRNKKRKETKAATRSDSDSP